MEHLHTAWLYRFWIVLGIVVLLLPIGWAVDTQGLADSADAKAGQLKSVRDGLKTKADGVLPNQTWEAAVEKLNSELESEVFSAWDELYNRQKAFMTWPDGAEAVFGNLTAKDEVPAITALNYKAPYSAQFDRILDIMRPIHPTRPGPGRVVHVDIQQFFKYEASWVNQDTPATVGQILLAQEDVWLLTAIATMIAEANKESQELATSPIKVVQQVLMGGAALAGDGRHAGEELSEFDLGNGDAGQTKKKGRGKGAPKGRYLKSKDAQMFKKVPIYLRLKVDQRKVVHVLSTFASSGMPMRITKVKMRANPQTADSFKTGGTKKKKKSLSALQGGGAAANLTLKKGGGQEEKQEKGTLPAREDEWFHMTDLQVWAHAYLFLPREPASGS